MTSSTEFPANCLTNVHILHDFGEVAYIVCTVSTPPSNSNAPALSLEGSLARLRQTEKQFRQSSILAALDSEKLQLFTFYKKVDIVKDQRNLLNKFGQVLRANGCTVAYKAAARVPDLLKPENGHLYKLFVAAVTSSLKLSPFHDQQFHPINSTSYLIESNNPRHNQNDFGQIRRWYFYQIDLQIAPTGQLILTIMKHDGLALSRASDEMKLLHSLQYDSSTVAMYLVPFGQLARYKNGWIGQLDDECDDGMEENPLLQRQTWIATVSRYLKGHVNSAVTREDYWVEIEIPTIETEEIESSKLSEQLSSEEPSELVWKRLFWPAKLCFMHFKNKEESGDDDVNGNSDDPLQIAQEWSLKHVDGRIDLTRVTSDEHNANDDDEPFFAEDSAFDDPEHFQPFGPPAFPASQAIYPTPPDVVMTHATPGMSSVGDLAMTPAHQVRSTENTQIRNDVEMSDFDVGNPSGVGSGFYDEDLFEEMPDNDFGKEGAGDEPNWDFFDQPDFDRDDSTTQKPDMERESSPGNIDGSNIHHLQTNDKSKAHDPNSLMSLDSSEALTDTRAHDRDAVETRSERMVEHDESTSGNNLNSQTSDIMQNPLGVHDDGKEIQDTRRRRSSVYDGINTNKPVGKNDNRYSPQGQFWFDSSYTIQPRHERPRIEDWIKRRPSISSESSDSSTAEMMKVDGVFNDVTSPGLHREWTEYNPSSPEAVNSRDQLEQDDVEPEVKKILTLLAETPAEVPSKADFYSLETMIELHSKSQAVDHIAVQTLVDQISHSIFSRNTPEMKFEQPEPDEYDTLTIDINGTQNSAAMTSLTQLTAIRPPNSTGKPKERVFKLRDQQITLRRANAPLNASTSIITFWDSLSLQPYSGTKNIKSFCIHSAGSNIADGCNNFLNRISDTYISSNFGSHSIGRLSGVTNNGLISWSKNDSSISNLVKTCQRVGQALASCTEIHENVIIYILSRDSTFSTYWEICCAFRDLSEAFTQASPSKDNVVVQLQIVPLSFVASSNTIVIPPQQDYAELALEVYNRLPPINTQEVIAASGAAVVLAKTHDTVTFELSPTPTSPLFKAGPSLHVAYSYSLDQRWIIAAWTDTYGIHSWNASYCLRRKGCNKARLRGEVFKNIWQISHDLMSKHHSQWRLIVDKDGFFESSEMNEWAHIVSAEVAEKRSQCQLFLVAIETQPKLKVMPLPVQPKASNINQQSGLYGTPASTPQANITSPEHHIPATPTPGGSSLMNAPTPPEVFDPSNENDLTLVDPEEDCWAITLPFGINQSYNLNEIRPAGVSGFLLKRAGPKDDAGVVMLGIHLVYGPPSSLGKPPRSRDELLQDLIDEYRGLVTLSVARGRINRVTECVPIHLVTAIRGSKILGEIL